MVSDMRTAKQLLADRFARKTAEGLVDVKFYLKGAAEATTDELYDDVNGLYEAYERGDCRPLTFGDAIPN
jgi:hypothetical protein